MFDYKKKTTMKRKNAGLKVLTGLLFNAFAGLLLGGFLGIVPVVCAIGAVLLSVLLGGFAPNGVALAGVLTEVWTGEMIKTLRSGDKATWLDGIPDYSQYAQNDVIHLVDMGGDPDVLVNNTTYPIDIQTLTDGDKALTLDKFTTKATSVTDDELYALSYDKMGSVKERHASAILVKKFGKAIHAIAPASTAAKTPVIATTGATEDGATTGRKMLTRVDIITMKKKFDEAQVPTDGRRLVLCADHVSDLLNSDQKFAEQYYNYQTGKIANLYGFQVYEYVNNPIYSTAGAKVAYGTAAGTNEYQASVAFYEKNIAKVTGSTKFYYSAAENDPLSHRNLLNYEHRFLIIPKAAEAIGAIYSAYKAS